MPEQRKACVVCGWLLPPDVQATAKYCSPACRAKHHRIVARIRARVEAIKLGKMASCQECGKQWVAGVDHLPSAIYCSPTCRTRAWKRRSATS